MPMSRMSNSAACVPLIVAFSNLRPPAMTSAGRCAVAAYRTRSPATPSRKRTSLRVMFGLRSILSASSRRLRLPAANCASTNESLPNARALASRAERARPSSPVCTMAVVATAAAMASAGQRRAQRVAPDAWRPPPRALDVDRGASRTSCVSVPRPTL